jgi:hypothetical protein
MSAVSGTSSAFGGEQYHLLKLVERTRSIVHDSTISRTDAIRREDVVASSLVPGHHLLSTLDTFTRVITTINWGFGRKGERSCGCCASNLAFVACHVRVGLPTACGNLWDTNYGLRRRIGGNEPREKHNGSL